MMDPHAESRPLKTLEKLAEVAPKDDPRVQNVIAHLRSELEDEEKRRDDERQLLAEYEEAYQKLTAPANRLGVFLQHLDDEKVLVAMGETEYVVLVDPKIERERLKTGVRVAVNEAFAVVDVLPPHAGGAVLKVAESLEDGRLRVGSDPQNLQGRLVERADTLRETRIDVGDEVRTMSATKSESNPWDGSPSSTSPTRTPATTSSNRYRRFPGTRSVGNRRRSPSSATRSSTRSSTRSCMPSSTRSR